MIEHEYDPLRGSFMTNNGTQFHGAIASCSCGWITKKGPFSDHNAKRLWVHHKAFAVLIEPLTVEEIQQAKARLTRIEQDLR